MQAYTERRKIVAEELADVADARGRELRLRRDDATMDVVHQSHPQRGPALGIELIGPGAGGSLHHSRAWTIVCLGETRWSGMKRRTTR